MSDYERIISIAATPPKVFATLTNVTEFAAWWHRPPGPARDGGELRLAFEGGPACQGGPSRYFSSCRAMTTRWI